MDTKNENLYVIDITKFLCSILIVCLHTQVFLSISPTLNMGFRNTIATIAVPFFFTISGFFFYKKVFYIEYESGNSIPSASSDRQFAVFKKTVKRLSYLYLVYSAVYFPFCVAQQAKSGFSVQWVLRYIYQFFVTGSYSTIWYLLASIVAVTASYFGITKIGVNKTVILSAVIYFVAVLICEFHDFVCQVPVIKSVVDMYYAIFGGVKNGIMFGFIYINIGAILAKKYISGDVKRKFLWLKTDQL